MKVEPFYVIGISVRTTNENEKMAVDITALWSRFFEEGILEKIPGKLDSSIYCVYTDYEGDFSQPYTVLLGCKVDSLDQIPEGMRGIEIAGGEFSVFKAKGNLQEGVVYHAWQRVWKADLKRTYKSDFEIYGEKAANPEDAEVDIFIGVL